MTVTDAGREADRTLNHGYFRPDETHVYLKCPRCRTRIESRVKPWASEQQRATAARDGLAQHLTGHE